VRCKETVGNKGRVRGKDINDTRGLGNGGGRGGGYSIKDGAMQPRKLLRGKKLTYTTLVVRGVKGEKSCKRETGKKSPPQPITEFQKKKQGEGKIPENVLSQEMKMFLKSGKCIPWKTPVEDFGPVQTGKI